MNGLLEQFAADPWGRLVLQYLESGGLLSGFLLLLVVARLTGMFVIACCGFANPVPLAVRGGLVLLLSLIILPGVSRIVPEEESVTLISSNAPIAETIPESLGDLTLLIMSELGLGALLGVGVIGVLSGLRLGGEWLNRHSGLGLGTVFNPDWSPGDSACSQFMTLLGVALFLLYEPIGGQWLLLRSLVESFQLIPLGAGTPSTATLDLCNRLVQQSLILGIRIAIPLVMTMLIVDVTLAFSSRQAPITLHSAGMAFKACLGLFVLAWTLATIPTVVGITLQSLFL